MPTAVLRAAGQAFDVDSFLRAFPDIRPERVWHRDEPGLRGPVAENGFSALITECEESVELVQRIGHFLGRCSQLLVELAASGAASVIDISLEVGSKRHYTRSIRLDRGLLEHCARLGVEVEISGYPVTDE